MASIRKEILIDAPVEHVWDAVRDVGAVHKRLGPGFLVNTVMDGDARVVTFANGLVARELIVDVDGRSRLVWIADVLPGESARDIRMLIDQAATVIKPTLEKR